MIRLLWPLSVGFRLGVALRSAAYRQGWFRTRRLRRPVVSVGNLTVGGTGKTPLVMFIAQRLLDREWRPGILTRGYKRRSGSDLIVLAPAAERRADPRDVGDEPALLAQSLPEVPLVIGADRYRAGRVAEDRFAVDIHLLDDGFQHLALARDVDVVAIDTTQELADEAILPAGRLREPCSALVRADFVILTRTELGDAGRAEKFIRHINPRLGIFRSTTALCGLLDAASGEAYPKEGLRDKPVAAFCGIGNPAAFFADLRRWGFSVVVQKEFPDHHAYRESELRRLGERAARSGAVALVTTEKDVMNFPKSWRCDLPVLAGRARTEILEAKAFEEAFFSSLEAARGRA